MTTAKQFLYSIRDEQKEIEELNGRIEELRASLLPQAIRYDKDRVQTSPEDSFSARVAQIADYERMLCDKLTRLIKRQEEAQRMIDVLPDPKERRILSLYFLSGKRMRMTDVAKDMGYSFSRIKQLKRQGLEEIDEMLKDYPFLPPQT